VAHTAAHPYPARGYAPVDGIRIWYAEFGHGSPVILLHGGLANAALSRFLAQVDGK
jgi:pimeloyl-ACP methyl ester carboxylesterase